MKNTVELIKQMLLIMIWWLGAVTGASTVVAQNSTALFQPFSWEQASLQAARENKLVLVEMGPVDAAVSKALQKNREMLNYIHRHVVAIRLEVTTPEGQAFLPRLLMYPVPYYAFFMPYGDLVGGVEARNVGVAPEVLREALEVALKQAEEKRKNSRSIRFADLPVEEAFRQARENEKPVFFAIHQEACQPCLLMDRNVYRLDRVADFYNASFVNLRLDKDYAQQWIERYGIKKFPAFLYLNADGKLLGKAEGYLTAEALIGKGQHVLKKAAGIVFDTLTAEEAGRKAVREKKMVFTDYYTLGNRHNELVKKVYADPDVNDFFTAHFVNIGRESDRNVMVFTTAEGEELHRVTDVGDAGELLREAHRVVEGRGVAGLTESYRQGDRTADFVEEYVGVLYRADLKEQASKTAMDYLKGFSPESLKEKHYWDFFTRYVQQADREFFDFLLTHRAAFYALYGEKEVRRKISDLWIAGAEGFVKDGIFDEAGFKAYTKRLKKEKVEGWRIIVRNARMHAAEQTADWKTYVTLAEEKWNEEKVSDGELYAWGVKIEQQCQDEGIRYIAARWFAERAREIDRKERTTGKVKMGSYKGFFEKLVNDLIGNH